MTFYQKGLTGYSIFGSGWLHPKQTTHVNLQRSGRLKVRAEILESALCGKSQKNIDDIECITDVRGDRLFIVKNGERNFQIRQ